MWNWVKRIGGFAFSMAGLYVTQKYGLEAGALVTGVGSAVLHQADRFDVKTKNSGLFEKVDKQP